MKQAFKDAALLILLPASELIGLRLYLHSVLRLKLGFPFASDYEFFLPGCIAFLLLIYVLELDKKPVFKLRKRMAVANMLALFSFLFLNYSLYFVPDLRSLTFAAAWLVTLLIVTFSALSTFVPWTFYVKNKNRLGFVAALVIFFAFPLYLGSYDYSWKLFGRVSSQAVSWVFSTLWSSNVQVGFNYEHLLELKHSALTLVIGKGCVGGEALLLFTVVFSVILALHRKSFSLTFWGLIYITGLLLMFMVNIGRIALLFWSGIWLRNTLGFETGTLIFKTIIHAQIGWLLYLGTLIAYFGSLFAFAETGTEVVRRRLFKKALPLAE